MIYASTKTEKMNIYEETKRKKQQQQQQKWKREKSFQVKVAEIIDS